MNYKRLAAILLGIAAVMALTAYAYIWEPARISGGEPAVTDLPVTTPPESDTATEKSTSGTTDTEYVPPVPPTPEIPDYIVGSYASKAGVRITLTADRGGKWREGDVETDVFWMYNSADDEIKVFDYNGASFVGRYDGGNLVGLLNYSDEIVFYGVGGAPSGDDYAEPPYNPSVFDTIDTFFHGGFGFTIYGAEFIRDPDGAEAVRVWFDFSNYSGEDLVPSDVIDIRLYSGDAVKLDRCGRSDIPEGAAFDSNVEYGETVRVAADFLVDWSRTDTLNFQIRHAEYNEAEKTGNFDGLTDGLYIIEAQFDPASLPALPFGGALPPVVQYW